MSERERLNRLRAIARLLDAQFGIPGTRWRFGIDSLVGLVPGLGDSATALVSLYILIEAHRLGVRPSTLARMGWNVALDLGLGAVPLLGSARISGSGLQSQGRSLIQASHDDEKPGGRKRMTGNAPAAPAADRELVLTRLIDAPRHKLYKAWTDPELLKQWFAPKPWTISRAEIDVRPGGASLVVMRDPEGNEYPNPGIFLDVVENQRLVFTDAYVKAWEPSAKPFMTVIVTFEDEGGKTRYTARALHWTAEDRKAHEEMGFHEGWGQCADQLEALAKKL